MTSPSPIHFFHAPGRFPLEKGGSLGELTIAYHTLGRLNEKKDNVIWVCHGLTANSDVADWWTPATRPGSFLDPEKYFIVCANLLGSHYGSTGPLFTNPATGRPYYDRFPALTIRDMARANSLLADHLGLRSIRTLVGASVGGFQALEWAVMEPDRFRQLVLVATSWQASPWSIALNETQRMAIRADATYGEPSPEAGQAGLATARALGLLSYRGPQGYNLTQADPGERPLAQLPRAVTYQHHQGRKLCDRFDVYSYMALLDAFDTHDIGRDRGGAEKALSLLGMPTIVVGIDSDIIFTPDEIRRLAAMIPQTELEFISSEMGHDGFLIEHSQLEQIIKPFIEHSQLEQIIKPFFDNGPQK